MTNRNDAPVTRHEIGSGRMLTMVRTLPADETLHYLACSFNVTAAREFAADYQVDQADITGWFGIGSTVHVTEQEVNQADLTVPLVFIHLINPHTDENAGPMLVSGWAAVHRAEREQVIVLPVVMLNEEQSRSVLTRWDGPTS
ncbi:hypothetical protein JNUCC0626_19770 [Lentzea sp. JNUCC 0626]|uniref:hypothetical protein n=1 Tax=Lentzea sp. JNUCC 0626 TaxID=3367513 RepID=UPI00374A3B45